MEQIVHMYDSETNVESNGLDQTILDLKSSKNRKRILTGELVEFRTKQNLCCVMYKDQTVLIPLSEMGIELTQEQENDGDVSDDTRMRRLVQNMLGSQVYFIVTHYEEENVTDEESDVTYKEYAFAGSSSQAHQRLINDYYMGENPRIEEGRVIEVRITSISKNGSSLRVNAFGCNCRMNRAELLHEWTSDLHEYYAIGGKILAKVTSLVVDGDGVKLLHLNAKCLKPNHPAQVLKRLSSGDKCIGEIVGVEAGKPYYIHLRNGANAVAYEVRTDAKVPMLGDTVQMVITSFRKGEDGKTKNAIGIITSIFI